MLTYIALLRGINVGGKSRIKMSDLKHLFESLGLNRVETYIQSGNVLFESDEKEDKLQEEIENEIKKTLNMSVAVILRTAVELEHILLDCPYSEKEILEAETLNTEGESFYVSVLTEAPLLEKLEVLNKIKSKDDDFRIKGRDIYILLRHSIRNSKLANNLQKLDVTSTIRNWKTINKLNMLAKAKLI